jgi:hypothetical protein
MNGAGPYRYLLANLDIEMFRFSLERRLNYFNIILSIPGNSVINLRFGLVTGLIGLFKIIDYNSLCMALSPVHTICILLHTHWAFPVSCPSPVLWCLLPTTNAPFPGFPELSPCNRHSIYWLTMHPAGTLSCLLHYTHLRLLPTVRVIKPPPLLIGYIFQ